MMRNPREIEQFIKNELQDLYPKNELQSFSNLLLFHFFDFSKIKVLLNENFETVPDYNFLINAVKRLKNFEPIQYIIGQTEFYDLKFKVNPSVLIPRPETEELCKLIIQENKEKGNLKILDIATGSGCIAIALKKNLPTCQIVAVDISKKALEVARGNSKLNEVEVDFLELDILKANENLFINEFDIIVSNPPYVLESEKQLMEKNVLDYEPHLALFVKDEDSLIFYEKITQLASKWLKPDSSLYFEINAFKAKKVEALMNPIFKEVTTIKDFFEKDRFVVGRS